jgi:hypothetical protein
LKEINRMGKITVEFNINGVNEEEGLFTNVVKIKELSPETRKK